MDIFVVIRTYTEERWHYLLESVGSVLAQTLPPKKIVIVVDHNSALAERASAHWARDDVVVIENNRQRGSSGAWNSGIRVAAEGEVIAFLDDDAIAEPDWLEQLIVHYNDANVVGVGGTIEPVWVDGRPGWFPDEFTWVVGCTYLGIPKTTAPIRNLIGCNMSFRSSVFKRVGDFRQDLGHQGKRPAGDEETELCIRIGQYWPNKVMLHEPKARVNHNVPEMRANWRYFCWRCYLEGRSKAMVSQLVGQKRGLSTERVYTFKTLPRGVIRGIGDTVFRGDLDGLGRAGAILIGLAIATASYLYGKIFIRPVNQNQREIQPV